jgi:uncharacterized protein YjiS (DUF1127 family)
MLGGMQCRLSKVRIAWILPASIYLLEATMSTCTHEMMINHHGSGLLSELGATFRTWRERARQRRELALWTDRDLHDIGLSWGEVLGEVEKPFWRA